MNTGKEAVRVLNITVSSGTGTGTVVAQWDVARWIRVVPIAETDTYDVTFKDGNGYIMGKYTGNQGTFSSKLEMSMGIMKTVLIESALQDGTYVVLFDLH
jgi:hypothetical protein